MAKRSSKTETKSPREAIIATALARAGDWRGVTLREIAEGAGLEFGEVYAVFETPAAVVAGILNDATDAAIREPLPDASLSPKDRIFDAAMNAFDALKDKRAAIGAMVEAYRLSPVGGVAVWRALGRLARVSLERAGVSASGASGAARIAALTRTLFLIFRVFAEDEDGLSRTMAGLDTRLREAERWAKRLGWGKKAEPDAA